MLCTDFNLGLDGTDVDFEDRRIAFGDNNKETCPLKSFWELFAEALDDFTIKLLLIAATISFILEMSTAPADKLSIAWIDAFGIYCAVAVVGSVTSLNNYQKV